MQETHKKSKNYIHNPRTLFTRKATNQFTPILEQNAPTFKTATTTLTNIQRTQTTAIDML